jgi:alpha-ketoglutarate-dependent taurine dioxygenase
MTTAATGRFTESAGDEHVRARRSLLEIGSVLPSPDVPVWELPGGDVQGAHAEVLATLRDTGVVLLQLDQPLGEQAYLALGRRLGDLIAETDPAVQPQVRHGTLLNLASVRGHTTDASLQPFATNALSLHSEGSGRGLEEQPRYILLQCLDAGDDSTTAQTVLVPMELVRGRLLDSQAQALEAVSYRTEQEVPTILRRECGHQVFSFRDFMGSTLEWRSESSLPTEAVDDALRSLLAAMYQPDVASGIHWRRGLVLLLDNRRFFHGRTAAAAQVSRRRRHLQRLRVR